MPGAFAHVVAADRAKQAGDLGNRPRYPEAMN